MMQEIKNNQDKPEFAIAPGNLKYIGLGVLIVIVGCLLMVGGKTEDPNQFSEAIFSFRRITLAPLVMIAGFTVVGWAIMRKPKNQA
ncbi:MAG: DUF3098 domain-containing protein [Bacteroidales bacterium]